MHGLEFSPAAQICPVLTDRLALIATKDGWTEVNAGFLPRVSALNNFAIGLRYALAVDEPNEFILATGLHWECNHGNLDNAQGVDGGNDDLSPRAILAKSWRQWNYIGTANGRLPMGRNDGN